MRVDFTIPGKPFAKRRPRFSRKLGRAFDPKENGAFENSVASIALPHFSAPLEGPVRLDIRVTFGVPPSWSKKKRAEKLHRPHTQKPDADNLAKTIADELNRIAWADDSQIFELSVRKVWGISDATYVTVEAV